VNSPLVGYGIEADTLLMWLLICYWIDMTQEEAYEIFKNQNGLCKFTKLPISFLDKNGQRKSKTASLDRIDNSKGYNKGNAQWVHKTINMMKRDFSENEFIELCRLVSEYNKNKLMG
jgi:hypothetical protein